LATLYSLRAETFFWDASASLVPEPGAAGPLEMAAGARAESCGLAADAAQVRVTVWVEGDSLGQELLIGKVNPDEEGTVFAKRSEIDAIYTVTNAILEACACEVSSLRDRSVFSAAASDVGRITLTAGESKLELIRAPGLESSWSVVDPVQWAADRLEVLALAERLAALSVHSYLDVPEESLEVLGLAPPHYAIALDGIAAESPEGDAVGSVALAGGGELLLGAMRPDGLTRFAKMRGHDELFAVSEDQLEWLGSAGVNPLMYRDRTMLALTVDHVRRITASTSSGEQGVMREEGGTWNCIGADLLEPELETIEQVLFSAASVRAVRVVVHNPKSLTEYGLEAPVASVTFGLQGAEGIQKSLLIGRADEANLVFAMVRGQDVVFLIPDALASLFQQPLCRAVAPPSEPPEEAETAVLHEDD
ncbi:MAG: DUF4340 domain-containing protein, partial [Verrucomicrobia bacterium]|nr:DUF4340 domain-containing protein [Verrucomicrobiota bacterium]